ncbi:MAG TPA: MFS transporter [Schlesneria sp.]|jgi:predicted MFS family arabinose efflux permease
MTRKLLTLAMGMFALGTDNFVVAGILPGVAKSLGTSVSLAGQMVTIYALTFAVLAPVMAAIGSDWPRKRMLVSALCVFVVGNVVTAIGTDLNTVLAGRALAGVGAAMFAPTALGVAATLAGPERRGQALSLVTAGLAGATALGAPLGTFIGGISDWRSTLWFVAVIAAIAVIGVCALFSEVPTSTRLTIRERFAPVRDLRIALVLITTLFTYGGFLMVYTYVALCLDRVTDGDERVLAAYLFLWGVAATIGNLIAGPLVDKFESRKIINAALLIAILNFCLFPWTSADPITASFALVTWAICGWGMMVPQQHRLVTTAPEIAPLLLALNNTAFYIGLACSGAIGGLVIAVVDRHFLSLVGAASLLIALSLAEWAHIVIIRRSEGVLQPGLS